MTKKEVKEKCSTHKGKWLEPFRRSFVQPDRSILNVFGARLRRAQIIERKTLGEQLQSASLSVRQSYSPEWHKSPLAVAQLAYLLVASFFPEPFAGQLNLYPVDRQTNKAPLILSDFFSPSPLPSPLPLSTSGFRPLASGLLGCWTRGSLGHLMAPVAPVLITILMTPCRSPFDVVYGRR